jgi:hypothetical protein
MIPSTGAACTRGRQMTPIAVAAVLLALALAVPTAMADESPLSAPCGQPGQLLSFYVDDDWGYSNALVIHRDGHAWFCWRHGMLIGDASSGWSGLVLSTPKLAALKAALGQIGIRRLGPPAELATQRFGYGRRRRCSGSHRPSPTSWRRDCGSRPTCDPRPSTATPRWTSWWARTSS